MSPELELLLKIIGGIGMLTLPFVALGFLSHYSSKFAAGRVGCEYCDTNCYEFLAIEVKKTHYTLKYRNAGDAKKQNFRMVHVFGKIIKVEWLT